MRFIILSALALTGLAAAHAAAAETITKTLDGSRLDLRLNCFKHVAIDPEPGLQGKVEIVATADRHEELEPLSFSGGATAAVERTGQCPNAGGFHLDITGSSGHLNINSSEYTLTLAIKVPPATPIEIKNAGSGDYRIGPVNSALRLELRGSGNVEAADATDLDLRISGSGDVALHRLAGPGKIEIHGSGNVAIDDGTIPSLDVTVHGSGEVKVAGGSITTLDASTTGSGDIKIRGTVKDATLSTVGSGDIDLAKATGDVRRHQTGSGDIRVGK
jgi:hypothetical protein